MIGFKVVYRLLTPLFCPVLKLHYNKFCPPFSLLSVYYHVLYSRYWEVTGLDLCCFRVLRGDRPYWWVGENPELWNSSRRLIQVPITCETGPGETAVVTLLLLLLICFHLSGLPSGHVMISLAVLLCCCQYVGSTGRGRGEGGSGSIRQGHVKRRLAQCCVLTFALVIGLTRVLVSSHFVHQVVM